MDDHSFRCTACGRCCRDMVIPLTYREAVDWSGEGGSVCISAQLLPWVQAEIPAVEAAIGKHAMDWWHARTRPARCGKLDVRVSLCLYATITGPCHHLKADKLCGIHERRPLVCRSYPVEVNDPPGFAPLDPRWAACPPEAWTTATASSPAPTAERVACLQYQDAWKDDQDGLHALCKRIGFRLGAVPGDAEALLPVKYEDLRIAHSEPFTGRPAVVPWWTLVSVDPAVVADFRKRGALVEKSPPNTVLYVARGVEPRALRHPK